MLEKDEIFVKATAFCAPQQANESSLTKLAATTLTNAAKLTHKTNNQIQYAENVNANENSLPLKQAAAAFEMKSLQNSSNSMQLKTQDFRAQHKTTIMQSNAVTQKLHKQRVKNHLVAVAAICHCSQRQRRQQRRRRPKITTTAAEKIQISANVVTAVPLLDICANELTGNRSSSSSSIASIASAAIITSMLKRLTLLICSLNFVLSKFNKRYNLWQLLFAILFTATITHKCSAKALLLADQKFFSLDNNNSSSGVYGLAAENIAENVLNKSSNSSGSSSKRLRAAIGNSFSASSASLAGGGGGGVSGNGYLDKLDTLERSVAAVIIKVAYGTTSTTKRSIPDNTYVPSLTTIATPLLTTLRYTDKSSHQQQINLHHRNYELDLERDHALPTSAPNADILKSNSNPAYPNPNRHHNHDRERHRHLLNSTPVPALPNIIKKTHANANGQSPSIPMYPGDIPSYSPPARAFFTPPLPPEYQNPFADKPTLRGTNNDGSSNIITNPAGSSYINRRPIPPPSLMPGHERIPFRPPDLAASTGSGNAVAVTTTGSSSLAAHNPIITSSISAELERKKALNTPATSARDGNDVQALTELKNVYYEPNNNKQQQPDIIALQSSGGNGANGSSNSASERKVLPSIRRILSGEIPEVLLKQVTTRPLLNYHQPPSSPVVLIDGNTAQQKQSDDEQHLGATAAANINKSKYNTNDGGGGGGELLKTELYESYNAGRGGGATGATLDMNSTKLKTKVSLLANQHDDISSTPAAGPTAMLGADGLSTSATTTTTTSIRATDVNMPATSSSTYSTGGSSSSSTTATQAAAAAVQATWTIAWNIHVYLSVILFTILAVYSFYKIFTYNKLTHLFSQSYFLCIHLILLIICTARIFYLCYDPYNIHASFHIFVAEILLNLPATLLTISFAVLILYLFLKSLNHKNNRYSALIRPLTVVVGCGVHVVLCITLHYVESYTMQNQAQHLHYQQQQQFYRQRQQQSNLLTPPLNVINTATLVQHTVAGAAVGAGGAIASMTMPQPPLRVLSLICQIIYIFVCLILGILYLYLYRILKRILRSKSQNYIHGYQNLSYAIHITIATALLFVLLATLEIFGAISISTTRPLVTQVTAEIDWLQWGYQFSLRLIEIAIIFLISWVAGLKTSGGGGGGAAGNNNANAGIINGADMRHIGGGGAGGTGNNIFAAGGGGAVSAREKYPHTYNNHANVAGFFLPCTSSSSQEQFDTDYPAVCNANTNLHTYTMRTGKLIYDDSFALNSLAGAGGNASADYQLQHQQQLTYQHAYDSASVHSSVNHNVADYGGVGAAAHNFAGHRYHHDATHHYADYLTDATTDHYENPNFDLRGSGSGGSNSAAGLVIQKISNKTSTTSTSASSSAGSGSAGALALQHQMMLLPSDNCYSEPLQQQHNKNYDFNNLERPHLKGCDGNAVQAHDCWTEQVLLNTYTGAADKRDRNMPLERAAYENPERRSCNSTQTGAASGGASLTGGAGSGGRFASYNSFERGEHYRSAAAGGGGGVGGIRKSGTLNNIGGAGAGVRNAAATSNSASISNVSRAANTGIQTIALAERHQHNQYQQHHHNYVQQQQHAAEQKQQTHRQRDERTRASATSSAANQDHDQDGGLYGCTSLERDCSSHMRQQELLNSDDDDDDDMMFAGSNVECTNLINNEDGSCITTTTTNSNNNNNNHNIKASSSLLAADNAGGSSSINDIRQPIALTAKSNAHSSCSSASSASASSSSSASSSLMPISKQNNRNKHNLTTTTSLNDTTNEVDSAAAAVSVADIAAAAATNNSMLVAERGFVRFRALDDINNAQGVGIHNASIRNNQNSRNNTAAAALSKTPLQLQQCNSVAQNT